MSIKLVIVVIFKRGIWLQRGKGDFCLSELFKMKRNLYIASELKRIFFSNSIYLFPMAVDWVSPVLTCGAMFFAERQLRVLLTSMSYTSHMVSNLVRMGAIFITSWSYLVLHLALSRTFWNFNSAGNNLFSSSLVPTG